MDRLNLRKIALSAAMFLIAGTALAAGDPLEDYFYASGKIKVVIGVFSIILIGLFVFLFTLERRLRQLEKDKKH